MVVEDVEEEVVEKVKEVMVRKVLGIVLLVTTSTKKSSGQVKHE